MGNLFSTLLNVIKDKIKLNIKPRDDKDYYSFFGWLVSKRLVIEIAMVIGLLGFYYIFFINSPAFFTESENGVKTYDYDSISLRFTTGKVRILGASKYLAYEGEVDKGCAKGKGTLYRKDGSVVYEGEFDNSKYNGKGTMFYPSGQIQYIGEFVDNEYQGQGILYRENGSIEYEGEFVDNKKEGTGILYDSSNNKVYEGEFSNGKLIYTYFINKTTEEVSEIYTGLRKVYSDEENFAVSMSDINAIYYGKRDSNSIDESIIVDSIYILENIFWYAGKEYTSIYEIKEVLGRIEYEGNTYVTMPEATAIHILNEKGSSFFGDIEGKWISTFEDAITVESYDVNYTIYLYTFVNDGLRYNFYCKDRTGTFSMYSIEKDE